MSDNRLAIIIYSCCKNSDMWEIFSTLFSKYWKECPYNKVLVTDRDDNGKGAKLFDKVICKDSTWHDMISQAINIVDSDYVMLMMDDYLLCNIVDDSVINRSLDDADRYNAANIRFVNSQIRLDKKIYDKDKSYDIYTPGKAYSITTQIGIWNSKVLLSYMRPEWSAWDFERLGSLEICDKDHLLLGTKAFTFPYVEGVRKGRWMKQGIDICRKNDIEIDFSRRKSFGVIGNLILKAKTAIYNINPTLMLKMYNYICARDR